MKSTTLCYIEKDGRYLMLYRNKKKNDPNEGKWIGVGGRIEEGETPEEGVKREVLEETGLTLTSFTRRSVIHFGSDTWEDEIMYLFTADGFEGEIRECPEGELKWVEISSVPSLNLWEGDKIFLSRLTESRVPFLLDLNYEGDRLKDYKLRDCGNGIMKL